ncbi:hypothetical protein AV521_31365 [Streptomyces sp. IMTB 2501]|uniref:hypothetical protein n=1 Tax=Streptomyces sp. IMTB 2501 TaxID=1776340 RepID=UPI00096D8520|nr:hypothetical protein [Streptomyces sp. IMTB 2501]OLZ65557.1 hypothetical protein AV521_31365 [Streptomyces sp. IMTB 2501]
MLGCGLIWRLRASSTPYPTVRDFVAARRKEIAAHARAPVEAFVTRHNALGADTEVDFGDVQVDLAGQRARCYVFAFRLACSGKAVLRISRSCGQPAFFEGHVHALTTLGGVMTGEIHQDSLTPAVKKVALRSRSREENPRWTNFHEYYGFTRPTASRVCATPTRRARSRARSAISAATTSRRCLL